MLFQTVAESRCISGENFELYGATSQMRREAQIEHRVSDFETFYQQASQNSDFSSLITLSQIFDIKQSVRIQILGNDINLSNAQIMAHLISEAMQSITSFPAYQDYNDENPESRLLFLLVERLGPIYLYFLNLAQCS